MTPSPDIPGIDDLRLGIKSLTIVDALSRARPRYVDISVLVDRLYSMDANGGPDNASKSVIVMICKLRPRLRAIGWRITDSRMGRGTPGRYRLEPVAIQGRG